MNSTVVFTLMLLPLAGSVFNMAFGKRLKRPFAGVIASLVVVASFVLAVVAWLGLLGKPSGQRVYDFTLFNWISSGNLHLNVGAYLDPLSVTMILFVTGISALIHIYSIGYMGHDERFSSFFAYLNLFVFAMLVLVLSDNFVFTFLGWEGVGATSYWLIAFWFERPTAAAAGKKAFIVNRIGDFGYLTAVFLLFTNLGSLSYGKVFGSVGQLSHTTVIAIAILFFVGAVGKSAQLPLFVWLVDAMEGPTPVSALIHAATMVTAGVYLMARISPILHLTAGVGTLIAYVGVITAFIAAMAATSQTDIKKVLAYSTVSQLGYMFLGIGTGQYIAAIFLMVTHAFYKALLFLGAGSVIHGMNDEQNIKRMGALGKLMPATAVTFILAWLSIAGLPPFSGFWSKGDVLAGAYQSSVILWVIGALTAILTAYYMGREVYLVFFGQRRFDPAVKVHESPKVMLIPLYVLATLSVIGGALNLPISDKFRFLENWLTPVFGHALAQSTISSSARFALGAADGVFALIGIGVAWSLWVKSSSRPAVEPALLAAGWGIDGFYDRVIARSSTRMSQFFTDVIEVKVVDGATMSVASLVGLLGKYVRKVQSGYIRNYALYISIGALVILGYFVARAGA
ncbi:MAG: NADH-quinone oxidoreductase subunit L [Actinomycetota bacterium]|nr:NADH-quinone oxidoreductase subunit L [Actinomycetota bacterium]